MKLRLEWTPKNENRVIIVGTLIFAVLLTLLALVWVRAQRAAHEEAPAPSATTP